MATDNPTMKVVRARGIWAPPIKIEVQAGEFPGIVMDQPTASGGTNQGPNPMELLLASLIGCEAVTMAQVALEMDFRYSGFSCEVEGDLDIRGFMGTEGICRYYCGLRGTVTVETEESQERLELIRQQVHDRCPVYSLLYEGGVPMDITWRKASELPVVR